MSPYDQTLIGILYLLIRSMGIICKKWIGKCIISVSFPCIEFKGFVIILSAGMPEDPHSCILGNEALSIRRQNLHKGIPFPVSALLGKVCRLCQFSGNIFRAVHILIPNLSLHHDTIFIIIQIVRITGQTDNIGTEPFFQCLHAVRIEVSSCKQISPFSGTLIIRTGTEHAASHLICSRKSNGIFIKSAFKSRNTAVQRVVNRITARIRQFQHQISGTEGVFLGNDNIICLFHLLRFPGTFECHKQQNQGGSY